MTVPRLPPADLEASVAAATEGFASVLVALAEAGAAAIAPSHVLIALARIRGGVLESLLAREGMTAERVCTAIREATRGEVTGAAVPTDLGSAARTHETERLLDELDAAPRPVDERALLAATLRHLEPAARSLVVDVAGLDLDSWRRELTSPRPSPPALLDAGGALTAEHLSPAAGALLGSLPHGAGTAELLDAMAGPPDGLLAVAATWHGVDLTALRARIARLARTGDPDAPAPLSDALRDALERAARAGAARGATTVAERDLLEGLLAQRHGMAAAVLEPLGLSARELRRVADEVHRERVPGPATAPGPVDGPPVEQSLDQLRDKLIGQPDVVDRLLPRVATIRRAARRGYRLGERPLATFLFCGPSGTGKTMTARLLAETIFGSRENLLSFDMGQFNTKESINNFIGAPPGYHGWGEGALTQGLAARPRAVLLFDEAEKAHPKVMHALLGLLDEGRVQDPAGPVHDARDTVVVLTGNVAVSDEEGPLRDALERVFRPELLNRIDDALRFRPFDRAGLEAIAGAALRRHAREMATGLGVELRWDDDVPGHLAHDASTERPAEAARGVDRSVGRLVPLVLERLDTLDEAGPPSRGGPLAVRAVVHGDRLDVVVHDDR